jgi:hypothetical protein
VDTKVLAKIDRLLKRFPETWVHTRETNTVNGATVTFHHVDYKSNIEGRPKVRLVSHVSSDMCELLVDLKANAPALIAAARASAPAAEDPSYRKAPRVSKVNNRRRNSNA